MMSFDFKNDPFENFLKSYQEAQTKGIPDANAMALSTVDENHKPSVRTVLYKGLINRGFSFYTNYEGRKARDIKSNNNVAALFFWSHLDRQIRIQGTVEKLSREASENYFATRPRLSQLGAWTSNQSEKIESFEIFQKKIDEIDLRFQEKIIPCPPHWGGYRIEPSEIEFWFGKAGRLHERYVYEKTGSGWNRFLRAP